MALMLVARENKIQGRRPVTLLPDVIKYTEERRHGDRSLGAAYQHTLKMRLRLKCR